MGTNDSTTVNWAQRVRGVQRRLATASHLASSFENRVTIFNVIMLPAILCTATVFDMPLWAEKQQQNLQRNFLWKHSTSTAAGRHKVNPDWFHTTKQVGDIGLASIGLACKTQKVKNAILWLIQKRDDYFAVWSAWAFRGFFRDVLEGISPEPNWKRHPSTPGDSLTQLLSEWMAPCRDENNRSDQARRESMNQIASMAITWSTEEEWVMELEGPINV
ncbi:RxLR effector protein [Phytophthora megakarya]|uniref:RxLR effector protein n=1 Tax=Phytophthora megakarya TaxID=4795 RepID=A0A225W873_9STRA|nr:RxLR effector protein [Phytophthora megakarya]